MNRNSRVLIAFATCNLLILTLVWALWGPWGWWSVVFAWVCGHAAGWVLRRFWVPAKMQSATPRCN